MYEREDANMTIEVHKMLRNPKGSRAYFGRQGIPRIVNAGNEP